MFNRLCSMSKLARIQTDFLEFLLGHSNTFIDHVARQPPVARQTRLDIYHNAYRMRLRETIDTDHPVLGVYLGDQLYNILVAGYIAAFPSTVRSLRHFCQDLSLFLSSNQPFSQQQILSEIAEFERLLLAAFDAKDASTVTVNQLASVAAEHWPAIKLVFHPSSAIFCQYFNAVAIWQAIKAQQQPPTAIKAVLPGYWLVWRNRQRLTEFYHIDAREQALWVHFRCGGDFAQGCELLTQYYPEQQIPAATVSMLQNWLAKGIVSQIN